LFRHIGVEEKILLPAAQTARGGNALPLAAKLRLDHGALAALLVLTPTNAIIAAIRAILAAHNPTPHHPGGSQIRILHALSCPRRIATAI
jgi:hypothetical protein